MQLHYNVFQMIDTYCWIHSTFTVVIHPKAKVGVDGNQAHPGVGPITDEDKLEHKYYQWVCFVLFFQAILFQVPRYVLMLQ